MTDVTPRRASALSAPGRGADGAERAGPDWRRAELVWRQRGPWHDPTWTLTADGVPAATYRRLGFLRRRGVAETPGAEWHVTVRGFFPVMEIARAGDAAPAAVHRSGFLRPGRIEVAGGPTLRVSRRPWSRQWTLANAEGFPLLHVQQTWRWIAIEGAVRLEDAGRRLAPLEPIVLLVWAAVIADRTRIRSDGSSS